MYYDCRSPEYEASHPVQLAAGGIHTPVIYILCPLVHSVMFHWSWYLAISQYTGWDGRVYDPSSGLTIPRKTVANTCFGDNMQLRPSTSVP